MTPDRHDQIETEVAAIRKSLLRIAQELVRHGYKAEAIIFAHCHELLGEGRILCQRVERPLVDGERS